MDDAPKARIDRRQFLLVYGIGEPKRERVGSDCGRFVLEVRELVQALNQFPFLFLGREDLKWLVTWPGLGSMASEVGDPVF